MHHNRHLTICRAGTEIKLSSSRPVAFKAQRWMNGVKISKEKSLKSCFLSKWDYANIQIQPWLPIINTLAEFMLNASNIL